MVRILDRMIGFTTCRTFCQSSSPNHYALSAGRSCHRRENQRRSDPGRGGPRNGYQVYILGRRPVTGGEMTLSLPGNQAGSPCRYRYQASHWWIPSNERLGIQFKLRRHPTGGAGKYIYRAYLAGHTTLLRR